MRSETVLELQQRIIALHCHRCGEHREECLCPTPLCIGDDEHVYMPESRRVTCLSDTYVQCIFCTHWTREHLWDTLPRETVPELPDDGLGSFRGLKSALAIYVLTIAICGVLTLVYMAVTL